MRCLISIITIITTIFLFSCAKNSQNYLTHAQTIQAIKASVNIPIKPGKNYYPIFNVDGRTLPVTQSPSLVPPCKVMVTFQHNTQGIPIVTISEKSALAWIKVGSALQKTPYQILDQDSTFNSYYILDIKSTNNGIIKTTSIYRVCLKARGNQTQIVLLNKDNQPAPKEVAQRILTAIQQEIL